jgi:hypothetical protein
MGTFSEGTRPCAGPGCTRWIREQDDYCSRQCEDAAEYEAMQDAWWEEIAPEGVST